MQEKEIILGYEVIRKKIKNINLRIKNTGEIYISAPLYLDSYYITQFILSKKEFIEKHIKVINEYKNTSSNLDMYENNTYIMLQGKRYVLNIFEDENLSIEINGDKIIIYSNDISKEYIKNLVYNRIYYPKAKKLFKENLDYYLDLMNEKKDIKLNISKMKSKWGHCIPARREISLSIELMKKELDCIISVIVHEIAHLKHPNHSKNFYREIDKYIKNYKELNKKLNRLI